MGSSLNSLRFLKQTIYIYTEQQVDDSKIRTQQVSCYCTEKETFVQFSVSLGPVTNRIWGSAVEKNVIQIKQHDGKNSENKAQI